MKRIIRTVLLCLSTLLAIAILPLGALAASSPTEIVSIQVNFTGPNNMKVIGTVVARRTLGPPVTTEITFDGMINGAPAHGTATAVETWLGPGRENIEIAAPTTWHAVVAPPAAISLHLAQDTPGLILVNGVPLAIDGTLQAPGSGRTTYALTDAGQGTQPISTLPNLGAGPASALAAPASGQPAALALLLPPTTPGGFQALFIILLLAGASLGLGGLRLVARRRRQ